MGKPSPLLLSPALKPIPGKIVEKIQRGENFEMKELLPDNMELRKSLEEVNTTNPQICALPSSSRLRDISDPLTWLYCYQSYMAVRLPYKEARDLLAYGQIVVELARKHPGLGWRTYDNFFRQQVNAGAECKWNELNSSLMAATVLGGGAQLKTECSSYTLPCYTVV